MKLKEQQKNITQDMNIFSVLNISYSFVLVVISVILYSVIFGLIENFNLDKESIFFLYILTIFISIQISLIFFNLIKFIWFDKMTLGKYNFFEILVILLTLTLLVLSATMLFNFNRELNKNFQEFSIYFKNDFNNGSIVLFKDKNNNKYIIKDNKDKTYDNQIDDEKKLFKEKFDIVINKNFNNSLYTLSYIYDDIINILSNKNSEIIEENQRTFIQSKFINKQISFEKIYLDNKNTENKINIFKYLNYN